MEDNLRWKVVDFLNKIVSHGNHNYLENTARNSKWKQAMSLKRLKRVKNVSKSKDSSYISVINLEAEASAHKRNVFYKESKASSAKPKISICPSVNAEEANCRRRSLCK